MEVEIKIPTAGESVTEATVSTIFKKTGDYVQMDEELFELETEKANQVVYAPAAGSLSLQIKVDDVVLVDQVVGSINTDVKAPKEQAPEGKTSIEPLKAESPKTEPPKAEPPKAEPSPQPIEVENLRLSMRESIQTFKEKIAPTPSKPATPSPSESGERETRKRMSKVRKTIAKRLVEAKSQTAMLTTFNEVDMSAIIELRKNEQEAFVGAHGVKLGFMSFFVKACALALQKYPDINAYIGDGEIVYRNYLDIGVAVGSEKGLFVPVLRNCGQMSFAEVESTLKEMALKARDGKITVSEMEGGGFTISNGGVYGSLLSTPIINYPQSAILGMHAIVRRPVAIGDNIEIRPMMYLAVSYDHRIVDGKTSIEFLVYIKKMLEDPRRFLLDL